ncbi:ABC transporter substrate-binding protein [Gracilibacillus alcaliphilus]|uniref:ABC transporter substrate-binding protein n=1 Tax=Gracilibacillus alcaliphilus TaxID=1401441 RepID=UPI00195B29F1|nr:ABC transporter substrate-binding protein [Gracilibacillus alcaliphilus]MBM7677551.1 multiple sugar transport system substrate-binding protein [Gracilibacillus alcaliphilus]
MKIKEAVLALVLMAVLFLAACSTDAGEETAGTNADEGNDSGDVIELDFWTFWGSETRKPVIDKIIEDFNNSQDEIRVKHTHLPWGDIWTKNLAAVAAGDPPDVIINDINTVKQRAVNNQVENITEYLDEGMESEFYPELWNAAVYEDDIYAVPFNTDTRIFFWNKDMFEAAGLDPEQPPATWAELEEYAELLDDEDGGRYHTIGFLPNYGISQDIWMMNATGQGFWDFETSEPTLESDKAVEALNWARDFESRYGLNVIQGFEADFGNQQANPFVAGKLAMAIHTPTGMYTQLRDYGEDINFGVAPFPEMEEGNGHTTWGGGFVAEVPYGAENPEASVEFIKYLTGPEAQEYWAVMNFDNVANVEGAEAAAQSDELSEKGQEVYQLAIDNMDNTILTPYPVEAPDMMSLINPELEKFRLGDQSAEQALENAQSAVEDLAGN